MPGESYRIHRASAVMTLTVSVIVTAVLMFAAAADTRHADKACTAPPPATRAC